MDTHQMYQGPIVTPVPDPTVLTTAALNKEINALKELTSTRLDNIEKSIQLSHDDLVRVPTDVQKQVGHLRELHEEKFEGIQTQLKNRDELRNEKFASVQKQFTERDAQLQATAKDVKVALDAALASADRANLKQNETFANSVAKSEISTTKAIDQIGVLIQALSNGFEAKISDIKDRLTRIEGQGEGEKTSVRTHQEAGKYLIAIVGTLIGIAGVAIAVFKH